MAEWVDRDMARNAPTLALSPPALSELQGQLAKVELLLGACKGDLAEMGVDSERLAVLGVEAELGIASTSN